MVAFLRTVRRVRPSDVIAVVRSRWMWIVLGFALGLGLAHLRGLITPGFEETLPSMREPEKLLGFLIEPEPRVRNVQIYPLREGALTQLATFELRDARARGEWVGYKAWLDVPVSDDDRTLHEYVARMEREGKLTADVRRSGWRQSYLATTLIVLLTTWITTAGGPPLIAWIRTNVLARLPSRELRPVGAVTNMNGPSKPPPTQDESYEFAERPRNPSDETELHAPEAGTEPKEYSGQWYPVERKHRDLG